jgi:hypothetical protein
MRSIIIDLFKGHHLLHHQFRSSLNQPILPKAASSRALNAPR